MSQRHILFDSKAQHILDTLDPATWTTVPLALRITFPPHCATTTASAWRAHVHLCREPRLPASHRRPADHYFWCYTGARTFWPVLRGSCRYGQASAFAFDILKACSGLRSPLKVVPPSSCMATATPVCSPAPASSVKSR